MKNRNTAEGDGDEMYSTFDLYAPHRVAMTRDFFEVKILPLQ